MSMIAIGSMLFGQGPGATLKVEWQNDNGTWERRHIISIGTCHGINIATLDNGFVITPDNLHRVRHWHEGDKT